jgi:hypothetical protein
MVPNKLKPFLIVVIGYFLYKYLKPSAKKARKSWYDSEKTFNQWYEKDYANRYGLNTYSRKNKKKRKRPIIKVKNRSKAKHNRVWYSPNTSAMRRANKQF